MATAPRTPMQPPHRQVAGLQHELQTTLRAAQSDRDLEALVTALGAPRAGDADGLADLLRGLEVQTPQDLLSLMQVLAASAGLTALSWARGLTSTSGEPYTAQSVLQASWAEVRWLDVESA